LTAVTTVYIKNEQQQKQRKSPTITTNYDVLPVFDLITWGLPSVTN
jgi:hypothetical protein